MGSVKLKREDAKLTLECRVVRGLERAWLEMVGAKTHSQDVLGVYSQTLGSMKVDSKTDVTEKLKGAIKQKIAGQLTNKTNGEFSLHSDATMTLKVASLNLKGLHVTFKVGSSVVSLSPGGAEVKASTIEIKGATKQSGGTGHG